MILDMSSLEDELRQKTNQVNMDMTKIRLEREKKKDEYKRNTLLSITKKYIEDSYQEVDKVAEEGRNSIFIDEYVEKRLKTTEWDGEFPNTYSITHEVTVNENKFCADLKNMIEKVNESGKYPLKIKYSDTNLMFPPSFSKPESCSVYFNW